MQAAVHLNDKSFAQGHLTDSSREGGKGILTVCFLLPLSEGSYCRFSIMI